ncbi:hypothetical protein K450DRAFT_221917 [Umbelopsis ramanniana AG]|uniref:Uncharacterized protein n=1 Tax=Umbelopsis ramanniana AG TaxID=1314678 RepID=A0AAD5EHH4_UMBRA|nr:uncharacterized protein K450DRAFT_221917 [Umbelopsis ramanniana AG]KAI8583599.1 hypothetical protein K450DRAFT_221917 [Umbelopsis ramanniana AG]
MNLCSDHSCAFHEPTFGGCLFVPIHLASHLVLLPQESHKMEAEKQEVEAGPQTVETQASSVPITVDDELPTPELKTDAGNTSDMQEESKQAVESQSIPTTDLTATDSVAAIPGTIEASDENSASTTEKVSQVKSDSPEENQAAEAGEVEIKDQLESNDDVSEKQEQPTTTDSEKVVNGNDEAPGSAVENTAIRMNQEAAVVATEIALPHTEIINGQESVPHTSSSDNQDDDAHSVASSAHSEAYESAGELPDDDDGEGRPKSDSRQDRDSFEDVDYTENTVRVDAENISTIGPNTLNPRDQEKADEMMREGIEAFFSNKFMKAKSIFKAKSDADPLFALGLGSMAFIKAIMTYDADDIVVAVDVLNTTCAIAQAQIDAASAKRPFKETVSHYISSIITQNRTGLPDTPKVNPDEPKTFLPNGVLRAHVVKAEGSLLISMLHLCQENVSGYLKCGFSIRRAYKSYSLVWQEYKKMGQAFHDHIDNDTISAIQFGIGSVHLLLSSLPPKVLKAAAAMGWKPDKNLGFALLKLCQDGQGIRSPLASMMLLAYYTILTSIAPQIFSLDYSNPALECLVEAQKQHPDSCFYLFFTGRVSRLVKNIELSTQSLEGAASAAQGEWAESPMKLLTTYDIAMNEAMDLDWQSACTRFEYLRDQKYWSSAYFQYFVGACHEIMGNRTESILAFASVPTFIKGKGSPIDKFVRRRVAFFEESGYADLDFSLPALELLLIWNAFPFMREKVLEQCLEKVDAALELVYERERVEYEIRLTELAPDIGPPEYYDQRAQALLIKAAVLNALGKHSEAVLHLNWIIDHGTRIKELWVLPFCYWEAGITSWTMDQRLKARMLWETGLKFSKYEFDYRMAVRFNVVLNKCDDLGIYPVEADNASTNTGKKMPTKPTVQ